MLYGLTYLGVLHTLISLVAVGAGVIVLAKSGAIAPTSSLGKIYILATIVTCLTGFGIFQHGGFGKPHMLGIATLLVLGVAWVARNTQVLGRAALYVETVGYSTTFFFHMIPAITEMSTRLPLGAPLLPNADAPQLQTAAGALFVLLVIGAGLQVRHLRAKATQSGLSPAQS